MAEGYYERVSADDLRIVESELPSTHRHVATVMLFDSEPLRRPGAGIDLGRVQAAIVHALLELPRYRQRLVRVPLEGGAAWIDDDAFDLDYHVQHVRLPAPADDRELKRFVGRMLAQKLDRTKPLWELAIVEGLTFERFAVVAKLHPALIASAGGDLLARLLRASGEQGFGRAAPFRARPAPGPLRFAAAGIAERLLSSGPRALVEGGVQALRAPLRLARGVLGGIGEFAAALGRPGNSLPQPFGRGVGPHRTVDWIALGADELEGVGARLGFESVEILVGLISAALRVVLRKQDPALIERRVRAACMPGGVRVQLPVAEPDPIKRIVRARSALREPEHPPLEVRCLRGDGPTVWSASPVQAAVVRGYQSAEPAELGLVALPGPRAALYLCGARMERAFPFAPLAPGQPLSLAITRYGDSIGVTLNADRARLPDLSLFTDALVGGLAELRASDLPRRRPRPVRSARPQPIAEA